MKVLHVIPSVAPRYGGPSRAIFEMCRALQEQRLELLITTTDADGPGRLPVELDKPLSYKGVPTLFFSKKWSESFKYSPALARWLDTNVKEFKVVHIHAVFSHACLAAAKACRQHGVPYVVRPLGTLDPWSLRQKRYRKRLIWHGGISQMLHGAAAIHYTTREEQRLVEASLNLQRGTVIPLGVEMASLQNSECGGLFRQRYPSVQDKPYILVLSRLHSKKGLELLFEVFLELVQQQEFEHWRLVVAGGGEDSYVSSLQRLAQEGGGHGRIIFTGWLEGAEKISALQNAALLALPSKQENFGLCIVEALACGVPVLVSPQVNLAAEIESAGVGWVARLERIDLLSKLAEALREDGERVQRGRAGREFVLRQFSWHHIAADLIALYDSITRSKRRA